MPKIVRMSTCHAERRYFAKGDGVCAICKRPETINKSLAVDHCHLTNTIRGLLCTNCNIALGKMGDSIEILKSAIAYLEKCTLTN